MNMAKVMTLLCGLAVMCGMIACSGSNNMGKRDSLGLSAGSVAEVNGSGSQSGETVGNKKIGKEVPAYTAVECYGLYGKVKSLKTDSEIVNFNKTGNVESTKNFIYSNEVVYYYETPFKYGFQEGEYPMEIKINNNTRIESHSEFAESEEFEFDDKHRLIRHSFLEGMSPVTHYFSYHGNDRLPESLSYEFYDETGSGNVHVRYTYLDVDKHGNWLRRKCNITGTSISYEGDENEMETKEPIGPYEEIETRKLLYY